jgi:hypothetical protein
MRLATPLLLPEENRLESPFITAREYTLGSVRAVMDYSEGAQLREMSAKARK